MSKYNPEDITINGETWLSCSCGHHFVIDGIIDRVKSQTRNDLLREIMEEMPKKKEVWQKYGGDDGWGHFDDFREIHLLDGFNQAISQANTILRSKL